MIFSFFTNCKQFDYGACLGAVFFMFLVLRYVELFGVIGFIIFTTFIKFLGLYSSNVFSVPCSLGSLITHTLGQLKLIIAH